jgi:SOS-response transcriptional repressor LexA
MAGRTRALKANNPTFPSVIAEPSDELEILGKPVATGDKKEGSQCEVSR